MMRMSVWECDYVKCMRQRVLRCVPRATVSPPRGPQADSHNGDVLEAIIAVHKIVLQQVRLCESCVGTLAATRAICVSCLAATPHPFRSPNV